jgi:hypothetical protein
MADRSVPGWPCSTAAQGGPTAAGGAFAAGRNPVFEGD